MTKRACRIRKDHGRSAAACRSREPLKIAFVARTSEIFAGKAEGQNRRRRSHSYVEDDFDQTTQLAGIAAVRSRNEFLEVSSRRKKYAWL
ncbi:MAG: hypothetical protein K8S55_11375 [Phycisphaerae bacterium]|nr:hypothetical protein [Phycisphaerae bacterium]